MLLRCPKCGGEVNVFGLYLRSREKRLRDKANEQVERIDITCPSCGHRFPPPDHEDHYKDYLGVWDGIDTGQSPQLSTGTRATETALPPLVG